jgi:molybdate transport system substrate-binding protein
LSKPRAKYTAVHRFLLILLLALPLHAAEVRVSAAASLTDAVTDIAKLYETKTGDTIVLNFGASSILATQIVNGAPADLFISADEAQMNRVATIVRVPLLSNRLVIIGVTLLKARRIAIANPEAVPAGVYAKQWLQQRGFWAAVSSKIIPTENVRAALAAVDAGNVDSAIVYATDARIARRARVAEVINDGPPIVYPAAVLRDAENAAGARRFLDFLQSKDAGAIFRRYGFLVK